MTIYYEEEQENPVPPEEPIEHLSITQFCAFVNDYTRHCTNPLAASAVCEQQADLVRVREPDLTPETIRLLMDTLLETIDHLEKKWLDEQIRREEAEAQTYRQTPAVKRQTTRVAPMTVAQSMAHWFHKQIHRHRTLAQPRPTPSQPGRRGAVMV
jgi:hypothetical protein